MATSRKLEKLASIDAQLRLLVPGKVSEDDKLVEYDALLLDRFLDILQDLHGEDLKETVYIYASFFLELQFVRFVLEDYYYLQFLICFGWFCSQCEHIYFFYFVLILSSCI